MDKWCVFRAFLEVRKTVRSCFLNVIAVSSQFSTSLLLGCVAPWYRRLTHTERTLYFLKNISFHLSYKNKNIQYFKKHIWYMCVLLLLGVNIASTIFFLMYRTVFQLALEEYILSINHGIFMPSTQLYGPF